MQTKRTFLPVIMAAFLILSCSPAESSASTQNSGSMSSPQTTVSSALNDEYYALAAGYYVFRSVKEGSITLNEDRTYMLRFEEKEYSAHYELREPQKTSSSFDGKSGVAKRRKKSISIYGWAVRFETVALETEDKEMLRVFGGGTYETTGYQDGGCTICTYDDYASAPNASLKELHFGASNPPKYTYPGRPMYTWVSDSQYLSEVSLPEEDYRVTGVSWMATV